MTWLLLVVYVVGWILSWRPIAWHLYDAEFFPSGYKERPDVDDVMTGIFVSFFWPIVWGIWLIIKFVQLVIYGRDRS